MVFFAAMKLLNCLIGKIWYSQVCHLCQKLSFASGNKKAPSVVAWGFED